MLQIYFSFFKKFIYLIIQYGTLSQKEKRKKLWNKYGLYPICSSIFLTHKRHMVLGLVAIQSNTHFVQACSVPVERPPYMQTCVIFIVHIYHSFISSNIFCTLIILFHSLFLNYIFNLSFSFSFLFNFCTLEKS